MIGKELTGYHYSLINYKKEKLPNNISLSKLKEKSITDDRITFEVLKNILSNLRRNNEN